MTTATAQAAPQPTLRREGERFIFRCLPGQHFPAKAAGLRFDPAGKLWWTTDPLKAAVLREAADAETLATIERAVAAANESIAASRATDAEIEIPVPEGLSYLPYQRAGIAYAMHRQGSLIGDEMGLGKTIQAIGVYNCILAESEEPAPCLIVCPASLRVNWMREMRKWAVKPVTVGYVDGSSWPTGCDVVIINYDVLARHRARIDGIAWKLLIVDECHYVKNPKAKRTQHLLGSRKRGQEPIEPVRADRRVFLTGTPIANRPVELWPIVHSLAPSQFSNWTAYVKRYCDAEWTGYGWDVRGASNLEELQQKLRASIMVRRLKADVLTELPPKRRQIVELPADAAASAVQAEIAAFDRMEERLAEFRIAVELAKASDDPADYTRAVERLREAQGMAFEELSRARHDVAVAKLPYVIEHLHENTDGKVIVFAHHKDIVRQLMAELPGAVCITGDTPMLDRQAAVDRFQTDPACRFFIGTIGAAGVGLTLTASSHVVFAELDWVPGNLSQAEDRAHRIGQVNSVLVQHLVLNGSLDARMAKVLVEKQETITRGLDAPTATVEAPEAAQIPEGVIFAKREAPATREVSRQQIDEEALSFTPAQIAAVHDCLRLLAGLDGDYAAQQNDIGFNRFDTGIGHDLAERSILTPRQAVLGRKIVRKYHRQLPASLLKTANGNAA
jgi:SNF2 family DNA or RNA helicase